jgi:hypothetical protein
MAATVATGKPRVSAVVQQPVTTIRAPFQQRKWVHKQRRQRRQQQQQQQQQLQHQEAQQRQQQQRWQEVRRCEINKEGGKFDVFIMCLK